MRIALPLLLFCFAIPSCPQSPPAQAGFIPACGDTKIKWDVKTDRSKHPIASPEPGKAMVYFLQDDAYFQSRPSPTVRFGLNGNWVGATQRDAYFYFSIDPGEHHLCANWQSWVGVTVAHGSAADHFIAEPGKSYFFVVRNSYVDRDHHPANMKLEQINSDEAQLLMSKFGFSTSHARK